MINKAIRRAFSKSYIITSGLYVPGNQARMLNKCVTSRATLLVPDVEDSVPYHEKPKAREMIRDHLPFIRENAFSKSVIITPRTNAPALEDGQLFEDDVNTMINGSTW